MTRRSSPATAFKGSCVKAFALAFASLALSSCGRSLPPSNAQRQQAPAAAEALYASGGGATGDVIRSLEERVRRDPEDFVALNKLGGYYLQRMRETGNVQYLDLARRAAESSLKILPAEQNAGAVTALAVADAASHDFLAARERALMLIRLDPRGGHPHQILGDALLELGDYEGAESAFRTAEQLSGRGVATEARFARLAMLRGRPEVARARLSRAHEAALEQVPAQPETVAWCLWQLGEVEFATGGYENAEARFRQALEAFPDYYNALAAFGRARAARGDLTGATAYYERAVAALPDPGFVAALGDLYKLAGREREAAAQYELVEQIARLNALNGALYSRQLALFYADHDTKAEEAYEQARGEYETRRDVYGADALAWAALKAGRLGEARAAIKEALRLGTKDARLFYHAGMIERAAGDREAARTHLRRALELSPRFDPVQSRIAEQSLTE